MITGENKEHKQIMDKTITIVFRYRQMLKMKIQTKSQFR